MPISSEAEIHAASVPHRPILDVPTMQTTLQSPANSQAITASPDPRHTLAPTDERIHLTSGSEARINSQTELELLSSSLDNKNRRLGHILTFLAQVLFWAAAAYVVIL